MRTLLLTMLCLYCSFSKAQTLNRVDIHNGLMHYYSKGEGKTILFIHGAQEDFRVFLPQVEFLRDRFKVVTYSRRYNFPNNNKIAGDINVETEREDLRVLVQKLGTPVHLVGHSYGGLIAIDFALTYPELTKSLILSEPALVDWLKTSSECETNYEDFQKKLISETRRAFKTNDTTLVMKELFEFFAGEDIQDQVPQEVLDMLKANLREIKALVTSSNGFKSPPFQSVKDLKMPIMVFTSGRTMPLQHCTNKKLLEAFPDAVHHHLENAGHEIWMTHSKELAGHISAFLTD
ncbi:alpha/beta hydrolase [Ulvibacterium sp.]|uniref:alpha/beta fold hydrolase n=1 Tax=Ulvibacterium sp. TaxID=2665914 RepID=UPI002627F0D7|nr:alpha/beta hydrolase [Ulvibacterium sp.]